MLFGNAALFEFGRGFLLLSEHLGKVLGKGSGEEHIRLFRSFSPALNFPDYRKLFGAGQHPQPPRYMSQCLAGPSLFRHEHAPSCGMLHGFLANTTQMLQSAHHRAHITGLLGFNYAAVWNAYPKLKEL